MATCSELRRVLLNYTAILLSLSGRKMSEETTSLSMIIIRDPPPHPQASIAALEEDIKGLKLEIYFMVYYILYELQTLCWVQGLHL
jgi:hypothetical protein